MNKPSIHGTNLVAIATVTLGLAALSAGCGGVDTFKLDPGHLSPDPNATPANLNGAEIRVSRLSTRCGRTSQKSISSHVHDGMEFSALEVGLLESPCDLSPSPRVEIDFEGPSLIFDFSTVERPGRFPDAEFDGYHFGLSDPAGEIYLITARVDELESSVRPTRVEVSNNPPRIDVSFDGSDYDDSGFAKIDLWFGRVEHTGDEAR